MQVWIRAHPKAKNGLDKGQGIARLFSTTDRYRWIRRLLLVSYFLPIFSVLPLGPILSVQYFSAVSGDCHRTMISPSVSSWREVWMVSNVSPRVHLNLYRMRTCFIKIEQRLLVNLSQIEENELGLRIRTINENGHCKLYLNEIGVSTGI